MTKSKTIVVCGKEGIFSSSIELLLAAKEDWEVVSVRNVEDWEGLNLPIKAGQPDVVIIHQEPLYKSSSIVLQLLQKHPFIKVIVVNLENNMMDVYSKQNLLSQGISGLITAIEA